MSLPPPTLPPPGGPTGSTGPSAVPAPQAAPGPGPGWYADPWDPNGRRWWDGTTWTGCTEAWYAASTPGWSNDGAADAVRRNGGVTRALGWLLPLTPLAQAASFATSSSGMRDLFEQIRDGGTFDSTTTPTTNGWLALGQILSMLTAAVLVLRMIWLFRAVAAARALGMATRRSPGLACAGWLIPIVNFWWPYQGVRDVVAGSDVPRSTVGWWWATYLVGTIGGSIGLVVSWFVPAGVAVVTLGVPTLFLLVSAVLERRLVLAAQASLGASAGLISAEF